MRRIPRLVTSAVTAFLALAGGSATGWGQAAPGTDTYRIGPEDVLQIQVWSRPDLSGSSAVDLAGDLTLPLLGTVRASGKSTSDLGRELAERFAILDAEIHEVTVTVAEYRSRYVTVVGEVRAPGRYAFPEIPGVWDVLLGAGGATPAADLASVQIVRKDPAEGEAKTETVDLSKGLDNLDPASLPVLRPRDSLIVPSLEEKPAGGESFQVLGAVRTPGRYRLATAASVVEALAISGGPIADADLEHVSLTRSVGTGVAAFELDLEGHLYRGEAAADMPLHEGDTITVPAKGGMNLGAIFSDVLRFGSIITAVTSLIVALN